MKYQLLWEYLQAKNLDVLKLSFCEIADILGFSLNHSFLNHKKEVLKYGYIIEKISLKEKYIIFKKASKF